MPAKILIADVPVGIERLRRIFTQTPHELVVAKTTKQAADLALSGDIDLIICGVHFNDSTMFDCLRLFKGDEKLREIPFIVFQGMDGSLSDGIMESMEMSTTALGACAYVNTSKVGHAAASDGEILRLIENCLPERLKSEFNDSTQLA